MSSSLMLQLYCIWTLPFRLYVFFLVLFDLLYFCPTLWYMSSQQNYNMTKILTLTLFCKIKMNFCSYSDSDSFISLFTFQKKWIADSIHNLKGNCIVVSFSKKDTKPILVESCMENWKTWVRLNTKSSWFY